MPIAAVEIEVSLQAYGKQTKDGKRLLYTFSLSYLVLPILPFPILGSLFA